MTKTLNRSLLIICLAFAPLLVSAAVDPLTECPKKDIEKGDSTEVAEDKEVVVAEQNIQKPSVVEENLIVNTATRDFETKSDSDQQLEDGESALSFNFVYYIFEKFKFSSSVDPQ